ncbi:AcrR family transcriptional regulator [Chryseobacterium sp. H1D6B]|uniref:TetR/AcrR family transcriptional regulator n=1 Tax=Chryseobacterium sp. H1D6B TaxID=2940588 RepID=UPI0015CB88C3|nr:TetR/AcrR family transcriptional regulator [Chryseobacterium sp. H1D6B]MDH6250752.1 AcrR family transcriptional regulator [Chryseobacterium sp. H1D6B]
MKTEKVKDRILRAASDLFYKQGFNSTGINQIIAEADIAIGSLYNHFSSKNELLKAYLIKEELEWFKGFEEQSAQLLSPKDKLAALVKYRKKLQDSTNFAGCHFIKIISEVGDSNPEVSDFVKKHKQKQKDLIKEFVAQIQSADVEEMTETIFLLLEGALVISTVDKNTKGFDQAKKIIQGLLS